MWWNEETTSGRDEIHDLIVHIEFLTPWRYRKYGHRSSQLRGRPDPANRNCTSWSGICFSWIQEAKNNGVTCIVEGSKQYMTEERQTQRTKRAPPPTYSSDRYGLGSMKE